MILSNGRLETRRCYAFNQLDCLAKPEQWPDLKSFAVIEAERCMNRKASLDRRFYISSLPADALRLAEAVRTHWGGCACDIVMNTYHGPLAGAPLSPGMSLVQKQGAV